MVGDLAITRDVVEACGGVWKCRGHEIIRLHALELRRDLHAVPFARYRQRDGGIPPPPCGEQRRIQYGLDERVAQRRGVDVAENVRQWERVLRSKRQHQRVFGGRRLQLEVELSAELLAQRQRP